LVRFPRSFEYSGYNLGPRADRDHPPYKVVIFQWFFLRLRRLFDALLVMLIPPGLNLLWSIPRCVYHGPLRSVVSPCPLQCSMFFALPAHRSTCSGYCLASLHPRSTCPNRILFIDSTRRRRLSGRPTTRHTPHSRDRPPICCTAGIRF